MRRACLVVDEIMKCKHRAYEGGNIDDEHHVIRLHSKAARHPHVQIREQVEHILHHFAKLEFFLLTFTYRSSGPKRILMPGCQEKSSQLSRASFPAECSRIRELIDDFISELLRPESHNTYRIFRDSKAHYCDIDLLKT